MSVAFVRSVSETGCALVTFLRIRNLRTSMKNKVPDWFVKKIIIINNAARIPRNAKKTKSQDFIAFIVST